MSLSRVIIVITWYDFGRLRVGPLLNPTRALLRILWGVDRLDFFQENALDQRAVVPSAELRELWRVARDLTISPTPRTLLLSREAWITAAMALPARSLKL